MQVKLVVVQYDTLLQMWLYYKHNNWTKYVEK